MNDISEKQMIKLEVNLLGGFDAKLDGMPLFKHAERSRQVINLFAYLLLNRFEQISQERLIESLWPDEKSDDPANALKNLVYRLRRVLSNHVNLDGNNCIVIKNGTYAWNTEIPCIIDAEGMENWWKKASIESLPACTRIEYYNKAISLYKGRFMADFFFDGWGAPISSYYQSLYMNCVCEALALMEKERRFEDIIVLCEAAITMEPYEEILHEYLLKSLISLNKKNKALNHYNAISKKFYKDLGVKLCDSIRCLHKELIKDLKSVETDISAIKGAMKGSDYEADNGAFLCDFEIFKHFYRLELRSAERAGQSVFLCLFTMSSTKEITGKSVIINAMEKLQDVIISSLRKGDVVSRFSPMQFILMLPTSYENGEKIIERIMIRFNKEFKNPLIKIDANLEPIISEM